MASSTRSQFNFDVVQGSEPTSSSSDSAHKLSVVNKLNREIPSSSSNLLPSAKEQGKTDLLIKQEKWLKEMENVEREEEHEERVNGNDHGRYGRGFTLIQKYRRHFKKILFFSIWILLLILAIHSVISPTQSNGNSSSSKNITSTVASIEKIQKILKVLLQIASFSTGAAPRIAGISDINGTDQRASSIVWTRL